MGLFPSQFCFLLYTFLYFATFSCWQNETVLWRSTWAESRRVKEPSIFCNFCNIWKQKRLLKYLSAESKHVNLSTANYYLNFQGKGKRINWAGTRGTSSRYTANCWVKGGEGTLDGHWSCWAWIWQGRDCMYADQGVVRWASTSRRPRARWGSQNKRRYVSVSWCRGILDGR